MTTPTKLNWKSSTPEQRNDACACFMPPSEVNPIRSWHLYDGDHERQQILAVSQEDAEKKLARHLRASSLEMPATFHVVERRRSVNYSSTPGGAWMLIEQLKSQGYLVAIAARAGISAVCAERYDEKTPVIIRSGDDFTVKATEFQGPEPFSELAAMLFLTLNGCQIEP